MEIKRIHIRYEDDFYNNHRPFSMGLTIEKINQQILFNTRSLGQHNDTILILDKNIYNFEFFLGACILPRKT